MGIEKGHLMQIDGGSMTGFIVKQTTAYCWGTGLSGELGVSEYQIAKS